MAESRGIGLDLGQGAPVAERGAAASRRARLMGSVYDIVTVTCFACVVVTYFVFAEGGTEVLAHFMLPACAPNGSSRASRRMHRTLKAETADPPAATLAEQQRRFDEFRAVYNHERPHEALDFATPRRFVAPPSAPILALCVSPTIRTIAPCAGCARTARSNGPAT